jgi:hypothetical protein
LNVTHEPGPISPLLALVLSAAGTLALMALSVLLLP